MIFEALHESLTRGELLLEEGVLCRFHLRRDGQLTIQEILVSPTHRRRGKASEVLRRLCQTPKATRLLARCPTDLESNLFWRAKGFRLQATETASSGRQINVWVLPL